MRSPNFYKKILVRPSMIFQKSGPAINKGGSHYLKLIALFISFNFLLIVEWTWSFFPPRLTDHTQHQQCLFFLTF